MPVKTITVTEDAYRALAALKRDGESFSRTLLRICPEPGTGRALLSARHRITAGADHDDCDRRMRMLLAQREASRAGEAERQRRLRGE